jgi:alkaline phosphatase
MLNRRSFLGRGALFSTGALSFPALAHSADSQLQKTGQKPARIIHMVADGMSLGTLTCADYLSLLERKRGLAWTQLCTRPAARQALMCTRSLNSMVTDSAAAASTWGSGSRVKNGSINQLPDGTVLKTLYELFADLGWKRGLVTTVEITHATPAGFAANVEDRDTGAIIASQYLERRVDLLLGGGRKFFDPARRKDKVDLKQKYAAAGYAVMETPADLAQAPLNRPWLGTFAPSHLPYWLDQIRETNPAKQVPQLSEMTRRALQWLEPHDHFILQIEGGRVDHGAHNCDAAAALRELIAFDEAVELVLEFQQRNPDTLVIITTDHGNGSMAVNGSGKSYASSSTLFANVSRIQSSVPEILRRLHAHPAEQEKAEDEAPPAAKDQPDARASAEKSETKVYVPGVEEIQAILLETTGYKVSKRRAEMFQVFLGGKGTSVYELRNSEAPQLGELLSNHLAIAWTGNVHTSDFVPLTAIGPGSERFQGLIQNVDVFRHYTELAGIKFKNPERPLLASGPDSAEVERVTDFA